MTTKAALLILVFSVSAGAAQLSETFSTRDNYASGTAIWNQALGKIHPSLQVVDYKTGYTTPLAVDVGDGSHGSFDVSTYAKFSVGGDISGNKIRFDNSTYSILKVTSFHLANGWVLEPVAAKPLIIYSLSDIRIEGEIWCHGDVGGTPLGTIPGAGGSGRCGGARGGDGGNGGAATAAAGSNGQSPDPSIGFGQRGTGTSGMSGGGGGSSAIVTFAPTAGSNGGGAGTNSADPEFTNTFGSAGGGGGAGNTAGAAGAGAGGGGGGGTVILHAVGDINIGESPSSATGLIKTYGGDGGSTTGNGGAGGGGGGGGVLAFSGGTINIYNNVAANASDASRGQGGTSALPSTGGLGGDGRSWLMSVNYNIVGNYTPGEQAPLDTINGKVEFSAASQNVISRVFHIESNFATFNSVTSSPTSADYVVAVAGSNDNFVSDDTGFTSDLSQLTNKNYFKFRVTVTTSTPANPTMLDELAINYTPGLREKFDMKAAGCGRVDAGAGPNGPLTLLPFLFAMVAILAVRFRFSKSF